MWYKEICILGDVNARVSRKENDKIIGKYDEVIKSDNCTRLIEYGYYLIIRQNFKVKVLDINVYRVAEYGSHHHLLAGKILINYRKQSKLHKQK